MCLLKLCRSFIGNADNDYATIEFRCCLVFCSTLHTRLNPKPFIFQKPVGLQMQVLYFAFKQFVVARVKMCIVLDNKRYKRRHRFMRQ